MMSKNVNIDIVRTFATLLVLSVHICQVAGFDFSVGAKGVQCFFCFKWLFNICIFK